MNRAEGRARRTNGPMSPGEPGGGTRLLIRERTGFGSRLTRIAMSPIGFVSFVMTRAMLRGIKARAEVVAT